MSPIIERRYAPLSDVEVREDGGLIAFRGHAAVFNQVTDLGPFREQIAHGAFRKTVQEADVRFLFNHEPDSVMARSRAGTLRLQEDTVGLNTEADLDPSDWDVQRLAPKLRRGDVSAMSFAFRVVGEKGESCEDHPEDGGTPIRTLNELALFDVSAVTFPAYEGTDGSLRWGVEAVAEARGLNMAAVSTPETPPCERTPEDEATPEDEDTTEEAETEETIPDEERQEEPQEVTEAPVAESTTPPDDEPQALKLRERLAQLRVTLD